MSNHNVRSANPGLGQEPMEIVRGLLFRARAWPKFAPRMSRPVVAANRGELCHLLLNQIPIDRECPGPSFQDDRRAAGRAAGGVQMHLVPAYFVQFAKWWRWIGFGCLAADRNKQTEHRRRGEAGVLYQLAESEFEIVHGL